MIKTKETLAEYRRGYEDGYLYAIDKRKMLNMLIASIKKWRPKGGRQSLEG